MDSMFKQLQKLSNDAKVYFVFEEAERDHAQAPVGSYMLCADFPHNGNLIGLQCHYGMLSVMKQLSEMNGKANVIKIDTDCFMCGLDWLQGLGNKYDMIGIAPGQGYFCKGTCYGISYKCICRVKSYLENGYNDLTGRIEDGTISMIAAITSKPNKVLILNAMNTDKTDINSCVFKSGMYNNPEVIENVKGFIDCGDKKYTGSYIETNLPVELAKSRALEFLLNFFQNR